MLKRRSLAGAALLVALAACSDRDPLSPSLGPDGGPRHDETSALAAFTGNIRIGVVPAAASVEIGSEGSWTITSKATGAVLMTGTGGAATVTLDEGAVTVTRYRLQVMCAGTAAVEARKAAAEAAGHATLTEPVPGAGCTRLYIGDFASNASFAVRNTYRNQLIAAGLAGTDSFWKLVTQVFGSTSYRVTRGGEVATSADPVVLTSSTGRVTIAGQPYRGRAEVVRNSAGLAGVNELPMEEYLYGVVPRELPPVPFGELEALKAQAVAARTYALSGLGKRAAEGFDLLPTTSDQVYGGLAAEHPLASQAVDETRGVVAVHEGKLIQALYSSTSGGYTANNEDVFNSAPVAYLRGVRDRQHGNAEHVLDEIRRSPNPASLRGKKNGDFEADWSRYHRWSFEWTAEEISEVIGAYAGQDVGRVLAINVTERSNSGRVMRIEYVTEAGTFVDTKDHVRTSLKYINASGGMSSLLSTLFLIEPVVDHRTGEVTGFQAFGGGWGHGVGLCQTGAVGMAEKGATYREILAHYYQGIDLVEWY